MGKFTEEMNKRFMDAVKDFGGEMFESLEYQMADIYSTLKKCEKALEELVSEVEWEGYRVDIIMPGVYDAQAELKDLLDTLKEFELDNV